MNQGKYTLTKELRSQITVWKFISLVDIGVICSYMLMVYLFKSFVHTYLIIPYIIFNAVSIIILMLPSKDNPGKKIYQSMYLMLTRDKDSYSSISNERKRVIGNEDYR